MWVPKIVHQYSDKCNIIRGKFHRLIVLNLVFLEFMERRKWMFLQFYWNSKNFFQVLKMEYINIVNHFENSVIKRERFVKNLAKPIGKLTE